jgi:hypothetical protein
VVREVAVQSNDQAAAALNEDWNTNLDGKQIGRWAQRFGSRLARERDAAVTASEGGVRLPVPANPPELLVLGVDGGRVQMRDKDPETESRWKEDKVLTATSYLKGDGLERAPEPLVTTHAATMEKTEQFGRIARLEAERRGWLYAKEVLLIADCGNWIDPLVAREFGEINQRIADWYHAEEHVHEAAKAACENQAAPQAQALAKHWSTLLWDGHVVQLVAELSSHCTRIGPPQEKDGPESSRRILHQNLGYFEKNQQHMDYPTYRAKGWPIGSGNTEAGVKQFNKRVKGTEQFWNPMGIEAILNLRALYLSQDGHWDVYWSNRPAYEKRAA